MRKLALGLALAFSVTMGACCSVDKKAVSDVEASYEKSKAAHMKYVDADPKLKAEDKDDWKKFYDSYGRLIQALKKAVE